jgi:DNA modification methylase
MSQATLITGLQVNHRPLTALHLDPRNPRQHDKRQISQIAKSIQSFGFNVPILVDKDNKILAGHGRYLASQKLGLSEVPTIQLEHLTEAQARAFAIADNRLTDTSVWNDRLLAEQLCELSKVDLSFDIEAIGFTLDEIELRIEGLEIDSGPDKDDNLPELPKAPPINKPGDLWQLGPHRLLCGDSTIPADVERLMNGQMAAMCFTDPPYNVDYANTLKDKERGTDRPILNDDLGEAFGAFLLAVCINIIAVTFGAIYICMSSSELHTLYTAFTKASGVWSTFIIWIKQTFTLGRADYQRQYEPILYGRSPSGKRHWCGARDQGDVWFFDKPVKNDLHPTMKPIKLVMRALRNSSERGSIVFDPFLGSGTTLIAAERTGRVCYGIELDPAYADCCVRRWQEHTGEQAVHIESGRTFDDLAAEAAHGG